MEASGNEDLRDGAVTAGDTITSQHAAADLQPFRSPELRDGAVTAGNTITSQHAAADVNTRLPFPPNTPAVQATQLSDAAHSVGASADAQRWHINEQVDSLSETFSATSGSGDGDDEEIRTPVLSQAPRTRDSCTNSEPTNSFHSSQHSIIPLGSHPSVAHSTTTGSTTSIAMSTDDFSECKERESVQHSSHARACAGVTVMCAPYPVPMNNRTPKKMLIEKLLRIEKSYDVAIQFIGRASITNPHCVNDERFLEKFNSHSKFE